VPQRGGRAASAAVVFFCATNSMVTKAVLAAALLFLDVRGLFWHRLVGMTSLLSLGTCGFLLIFCTAARSLLVLRNRNRKPGSMPDQAPLLLI
jgi:hypothetical protein